MFSRPNGFQAAIQHDKINSTNLLTLAPFLDPRASAVGSQLLFWQLHRSLLSLLHSTSNMPSRAAVPVKRTFSGGPPRQTNLLGRFSPSNKLRTFSGGPPRQTTNLLGRLSPSNNLLGRLSPANWTFSGGPPRQNKLPTPPSRTVVSGAQTEFTNSLCLASCSSFRAAPYFPKAAAGS